MNKINTDRDNLNCVWFTDNSLLICGSLDELQELLNDLNGESLIVGLKMKRNKTNVIFNCNILKMILGWRPRRGPGIHLFRLNDKIKENHEN